MTVKEFVDDVLCVPVTRIGNRFIVEAIELVLDTHDHKFYNKLASILDVSPKYLEKAMREAKSLSLSYMDASVKDSIFNKVSATTTEYVIKSAEYYRRNYENQTEG